MPASSPRVYLTLAPATYAALAELSRATGKPKASLLREFVDEAAPALAHMATLATAVQAMSQDTRKGLARSLEASLATATMNAEAVKRDLARQASRMAHQARAERMRQGRTSAAPSPRRKPRYPVQ